MPAGRDDGGIAMSSQNFVAGGGLFFGLS